MGEVLSLFTKPENDLEYSYLLINAFKKASAFNISSQVMKLSDDYYVHDLKVVKSYWSNLAQKKESSPIELIQREASLTYGEDKLYIFCHHPFEAYLLAGHLIQKKSFGFYFSQNSRVENFYGNLSLDHWFDSCRYLDELFNKENILVSERKANKKHYNQMEKMFQGLGLSKISDFKSIHAVDLQRRFSKYVGMLWDWTYPNISSECHEENLDLFQYDRDVALHGFVWKSLKIESAPTVKKDLDYPLSHWDHIKEELINSFDKLLRFKQVLSPNRLVLVDWRLTLFDLEQCSTLIRFKHPLCLLQDQKKGYVSLLSQFQFAFDSLQGELNQHYQDYDYFDVAHFCGWSIEVKETLSPSSLNNELFSNLEEMVIDQDIEAFQNRIKGSINRYSVLRIDIPSLDYKDLKEPGEAIVPVVTESLRPFFIFESPISIEESQITERRFIERTSSDWWVRWDSRELFRDYYMGLVHNELLYLYKDHLNRWYKHGLFS